MGIPEANRSLLRTGACWAGAPADLHDTLILPVFRLPHQRDSAHQQLADLTILAQDLAILARCIGPIYQWAAPRMATKETL